MIVLFALLSLCFADIIPISAKVGEEFSIEMASNPTTGYMWKYIEPEQHKSSL